MKFASFIITTLIAISSYASSETIRTRIIGRVQFDKSHTMTCLSTNCPESLPYYQLILDDAQVDGIGPVETVVFQDFKKIVGVEQKPKMVVYGGVTLKEGMYIIVNADVRWTRYEDKTYAIAVNPEQVTLAPIRYPVILY